MPNKPHPTPLDCLPFCPFVFCLVGAEGIPVRKVNRKKQTDSTYLRVNEWYDTTLRDNNIAEELV